VSKIEVQVPWAEVPGDTRLMIIELRKYNPAEELLVGLMNTGSQGQVINWNTERRVSVAMAAVNMKEMGMEPGTRYRDAYNWPPIQE